MKRTRHSLPKKAAGRPRTSHMTRAEQLRLAKRAQRAREREAGLVIARLKLPVALAERLAFAGRQEGFETAFSVFLRAETIEIADYPQLKLLCWNRRGRFVSAREAWELYERNWRFVERDQLEAPEQELIGMLAARFGRGVMNV